MTLDEMKRLFDERNSHFLKFDEIKQERRLSERPDLNAMLLLNKLCSEEPTHNMIVSSEHEEIYFSVNPSWVAHEASEEDILDLIRSGVSYSVSLDCFSKFV